jgi:hypothetical protein
MDELEQLNPRAKILTIGTRKLKNISIYPLSFADEGKFVDEIIQAFIRFMAIPEEERSNAVLITMANDLINTNIPKILSFIIDQEEIESAFGAGANILSYVDNDQLLDIVKVVYDQNFGESIQKKVTATVETWKNLFLQKVVGQDQPASLS